MSAKPKKVGDWFILKGYWDFVKLRGWLDRNTDSLIDWRYVAEPKGFPCLVLPRDVYNGGGYMGEFIYVTQEEARTIR